MAITIPVRAKQAADGGLDVKAAEDACAAIAALIDPRAAGAVHFMLTSEHTPDEALREAVGPVEVIQPPRILIGMPCGADVKAFTAADLAGVVAYSIMAGLQVVYSVASGSNYELNLNMLARRTIEDGFDALLILDADMRFPHSVLVDLIAHDKDVVGGTYRNRKPPHNVLGLELRSPAEVQTGAIAAPLDPANPAVRIVGALPGGCLLIKREVLEECLSEDGMVFRKQGAIGTADYAFCAIARQNGFDIWFDPAVAAQLRHIGEWEIPLDMSAIGAAA